MSPQRSVVGSAKLIALCTLLSRISGLAREVLIAQTFGQVWIQDAFRFGFQVPNLFRRLLGEGAMSSVFVPVFTEMLDREGRGAAARLLARTLALLCVALLGTVVVLELLLLALWVLLPVEPGQAAARELLISLTAVMLPFMLSICVLALLSAILNCLGSFVPAALAPVVLNVCMIVGVMWLGPGFCPRNPSGQVHVLAWTVVAAGVLQILLVLPALWSGGLRLGWRWEPRDPTVARLLRLLVPVALGQGVLAFGVYLDAQLCVLLTRKPNTLDTIGWLGGTVAYPLREGALSTLSNAQLLYQFPLGVLVISLATAAMPAFSRLAARGEWVAWAAEVRQTLRLAIFEGVLAGTLMIVLAAPIVRLLFEYRKYGAADTARTAHVLVFYGLAMWAYCAQHIVSRGFYSLGDARTPLAISAGVLPLNVALTLVLVWFDAIREAAFAISSLLTSSLSVLVGLRILQQRAGARVLDRAFLAGLLKMLGAAILAAAVALALRSVIPPLAQAVPGRIGPRAIETLVPLAVGTGVFLAVGALLRLPEVSLLLSRARRRVSAAGT